MLKREAPIPLHTQLYDILRQQLLEGEYKSHQLIPSENELSRMYNISRTTVRNVILRLANEQLVYKVPGKGTFVSESKITTASIAQKGIREQLEEMGYETDTVLLEKHIVKANKVLAEKLNVKIDEDLFLIKRLRYVNNIPLSIHTDYLVASLFPELFEKDISKAPLCDILEENYNFLAKYGEETLESITTSSLESKQLDIPKGFHVLLLECVLYNENDTPFEFSRVVFRGDRIKLKFSYERQP